MGNCFTQWNYKVIDRKVENCNQQEKAKNYLGKKWSCKLDEKSEKKKKVNNKIKEDIHPKQNSFH